MSRRLRPEAGVDTVDADGKESVAARGHQPRNAALFFDLPAILSSCRGALGMSDAAAKQRDYQCDRARYLTSPANS